MGTLTNLSSLRSGSQAAARAADALLRGVGGRAVLLRMPAPAVVGAAAEELGLAVPTFQDSVLSPVVFRKVRPPKGTVELLVSATAVQALVGSGSAAVLFGTAAGVVVDGVLMRIERMTAAELLGATYVYRLICRIPIVERI